MENKHKNFFNLLHDHFDFKQKKIMDIEDKNEKLRRSSILKSVTMGRTNLSIFEI